MAKFLRYEQCPRCVERGRDNRGDNLAVYLDGGIHCFACGLHRVPFNPLKKEEENATKNIGSVVVTREIPARAWQWLLQYGLSYKHWESSVGWSEKDQRLVFAIPSRERMAFSIGRLLPPEGGEDGARATTHANKRKWFVWGNSHGAPHLCGDYQDSNRRGTPVEKKLVLVEDWISANKVAAAGFPCLPLFGTQVFDACIPMLRHISLPLVLWLDNDQRQAAPRKAMHLSMLTGLQASFRSTEADPKLLSLENITKVVNENP